MQNQIEQLEQQLFRIQKWIEDKDKTLEYADIYEEISRMEKELNDLKGRDS
ncbi:hypothetical protein JMA_12160 [Jeotgalibacillus malaysiensis]|uniref:Uncharacterized protein n=1 Tax=Jeotgalibacillus malaysiensis TaxID=1508404 RepID=A0A0B5APV2_9BACL|nr:hypothetical protein [Jeotgalibacillus malaysiensis]AJD90533.1 hypothetical protein JMA_12160 [Jeotgalibacillus malaysiensis]